MKTTFIWTYSTRSRVIRRAACAALSTSFLAIAACGGGGGGGTSPPPPPPPPPPAGNSAPSAVAKITDTNGQEGQPFTLDASESTDVNNDPLTFQWVQTAGPAVTLPDPTQAVIANIRIPEMTRTERATFKVTVSDGKVSSEQSVDLAFTDIHQMPRFSPDLPLLTTLPLTKDIKVTVQNLQTGNPTRSFGVSDSPTGRIDALQFWHPDADTFQLLPTAQTITAFDPDALFWAGQIVSGSFYTQLYVTEKQANRLSAYIKGTFDNAVPMTKVMEDTSISKPCAVISPLIFGERIIVGQEGGGASVMRLSARDPDGNFTLSEYQKIDGAESFCALTDIMTPVSGGEVFDGNPQRIIYDMMAYDVDTNTVSVFEQDRPNIGNTKDTVKYQLRNTERIRYNSPNSLRFVKAVRIYPKSLVPGGLALLFTDDQHQGVNRMVIVGLDAQRNIVQQSISWNLGVPTDALAFTRVRTPAEINAIAVFTSTSPEAMVFTPYSATHPEKDFIPLSGPEFFEVGLGASLADVLPNHLGSATYRESILVMDSENHEARIYGPLPN